MYVLSYQQNSSFLVNPGTNEKFTHSVDGLDNNDRLIPYVNAFPEFM